MKIRKGMMRPASLSLRRRLISAFVLLYCCCSLGSKTSFAFAPLPSAGTTTAPSAGHKHTTTGGDARWHQQQQPLVTKFRPGAEMASGGRARASAVTRFNTRGKPLQASPLVSLAASPVGALGILASIILIHECGHYLAARGFGINVEEFSIGVGPRLLGFKAFGDEFNLRAIPLGGYVRFPENYNVTLVQDMEEKALKARKELLETQEEKDLKDKIVNILTLGSVDDLRIKEEKERRANAAASEGLQSNKQPWWKNFGKKQRRKVQSPELIDPDDVEIEYYDDPNLLQNRPWQQRAVVLSGGVVFNLLLSFLIYFGQINYGPGVPSPVFDSGALVTSAPRPEAAANGILRKGDIVLSVNGQPITVSTSPSSNEAQKGINDFISTIRANPDGESLKLSVLHKGDSNPVDISLKPKRSSADGPATIGVLLSPNFVESKVVRSNSFVEGTRLAARYAGDMTMETAKGLLSVFGDLATGKGVSTQVSGPIGLIETGTEVVKTQDWTTVLIFAAAISINLGVVNALPLPALDGGQLVFVLSEALTGRKVDQRLQEGISGAALFFLLLVSAGAAFNDIGSLFSR